MASASQKVHRQDPECSNKCQSKLDASELISAVTKCSEEESLIYIALAGVCCQPGKVSDHFGRTLLHMAASVGKKKVVEWLLRFKETPINVKDHESGYTALHRSIFYGQIHVAEHLISCDANLALADYDGFSPIDHAIMDQETVLELSTSNPCDVYVWGTNSNYNLGIGHHQSRKSPDVSEFFRKEGINCTTVIFQKFHSAFLSSNGQVYTCGHGRGGRLGHGHEEALLMPKMVKGFHGQSIVDVALGVDHTLFLTESGIVFACGTNTYGQVGLANASMPVLSPTAVAGNPKSSTKLPFATGIAASRYHSLFWTKSSIFTWGLNAGQLGHLKGEKVIGFPKMVTSMNDKKSFIKTVCTSEGAIIILFESGDIYALHEYQPRRITKHVDVAKIAVVGGHLDSNLYPSSNDKFGANLTEKGGQDLRVYVLSNLGKISVWEEARGGSQLMTCVYNIAHEILVRDFTVNKAGNMILLSKRGLGYEGIYTGRKDVRSTPPPASEKKKHDSVDLTNFVLRNPTALVKLKRIPGLFRSVAVTSDPKGQNFCVLQMSPNASLFCVPEVSPPTMKKDFQSFFEERLEDDFLTDIVFIVKGQRLSAHRFIVANCSDKLAKEVVSKSEIEIFGIEPQVFEQVLKYAYTKTCDLMKPGTSFSIAFEPNVGDTKSKPVISQNATVENPKNVSAFAVNNTKNKKKSSKRNESSEQSCNGFNGKGRKNALIALKQAAKELEVFGLEKALENFDMVNDTVVLKSKGREPRASPVFSLKSFPELYDVKITSDDGEDTIPAHRCILAARLEYFRSMFSYGWVESKEDKVLSLPVPGDILTVILGFLYREEAPGILGSDDPEFICNVLVIADQLLMPRLIQICEVQLTQLLNLKNAAEILQFAFEFNATQLQESAMQFIRQNLAAILENRTLTVLSEDSLVRLTKYYQNLVTIPKNRIITPFVSDFPPQAEIESFVGKVEITVDDLLYYEEETFHNSSQKLTGSAKKRNAKRRNSSGENRRIRNFSSSSISSLNSDSSVDAESTKGSDLDLEEFEFQESKECHYLNNNSFDNSSNRHENFLADFFSKKINLTQDEIKVEKQPDPFSKKFTKKSQRERQKELKAMKNGDVNGDEDKSKENSKAWTGWGTQIAQSPETSSNAPSFSEIMEGQKCMSSTPASTKSKSKPIRVKKASWKQISFGDEFNDIIPTSPPTSNPWNKRSNSPQHAAINAKGKSSREFKAIINDQVKQSESLVRAKSKSLVVLQREEAAIEALNKFYNVDNVFDERIQVARVDETVMATPIWKR